MTYVYCTSDEFKDTLYNKKCKCGHALYQHGFTMHPQPNGTIGLWVSQCVMCKSEDQCKEFKSA